jgi:hypothetical protein
MRTSTKAAAATLVAAILTSAAGSLAATAAGATGGTALKAVTVTMTNKTISFSTGTALPAGHVLFHVKTAKGQHTLQLLHLHSGYTANQAKHDINAAFGGDVKAVKRVDKNIDWLGGVDTTPGHPGKVSINLGEGSYIAVDQESDASLSFTVGVGSSDYRTVYPSSSVTTKNNLFHLHTGGLALPHDGWMKFHNNALEPHMFVFQHVKQSTTKKDVRDYIASGSQKPPSWGLQDSTDAGVISPGTTETWHYSLPTGKYLVACFWPSKDNGMPHFTMGMWKLVELS